MLTICPHVYQDAGEGDCRVQADIPSGDLLPPVVAIATLLGPVSLNVTSR